MTEKQLIRVLVAMDFSDEIMDHLKTISDKLHIERHFPDVPESAYTDAEILYTVRHFPEPTQVPHLRWIQLNYAGVEGVLNRPIIQSEDVIVTSASGIHATPIAEYCMTMMLAFEYKLLQMMDFKQRIEWPENQYDIFKPAGLRGKTLGIVGYGSIARELARLADTIGMKVLATKRDLMNLKDENHYMEAGLGDLDAEIPERLYPPEALGTMARECDYLVLTTPLTNKTRHMINEDILNKMKSSAVLINIARGGVIDEAALISALAAEKIAGAALDVFETEPLPRSSPLWNLDNVIISPHISGNNMRYHERAAQLFAENLRRYIENKPLLNQINREHGY